MSRKQDIATWIARITVGFVLAMNLYCAFSFVLWPGAYAASFEVNGVPGKVIVQGFGILFLMWNVTYPPVLIHPNTQRILFIVILVQQAIGLLGELWMWLSLPAGHPTLLATGGRFILFDGLGLVLMGAAFSFLKTVKSAAR